MTRLRSDQVLGAVCGQASEQILFDSTKLHYDEQLVRRTDAAVHTIEEALKNHPEHE
jgi:hypothetical protein